LHLFLPVKGTALHCIAMRWDEMRYREQSDGRQTSSLRLNERIAPRIEPDGCILPHGRIWSWVCMYAFISEGRWSYRWKG
jgi:hypothetical protein